MAGLAVRSWLGSQTGLGSRARKMFRWATEAPESHPGARPVRGWRAQLKHLLRRPWASWWKAEGVLMSFLSKAISMLH